MKRAPGQPGGIPIAALHDALVRKSSHPTVVADQDGYVIEWNSAAEDVTGISRDYALDHTLWEVQARVAPAHIPYEVAIARAHERFDELVRLSSPERIEWRRSYEGELLSMDGAMHRIRSEVFPIWIDKDLAIVSTMWEFDAVAEDALHDDYDHLIDQLERRICAEVYRFGRHTEGVDEYILSLRSPERSEEYPSRVRLDAVLEALLSLLAKIDPRRAFHHRVSPYLVRPIRSVEIALLFVELVVDGKGDVDIVVRPSQERRTRVECTVDSPASHDPSRRWVVRDLLARLDGRFSVRRGPQKTRFEIDIPSAILAAPVVRARG